MMQISRTDLDSVLKGTEHWNSSAVLLTARDIFEALLEAADGDEPELTVTFVP